MADQQSGKEQYPLRTEVFPCAPVVEAILSFRFPPLDNLADTIGLLAEDLRFDFSKYEPLPDIRKPLQNLHPGQEKGFRFHSTDARHVLRLTRTSFSFHRLKPYSEWADLAAGAARAWELVRRRYEPEYITVTSLRYLNQIVLPPYKDLAEYLVLCPSVPTAIDTGFEDYLLRLVLKDPSVPARAELTQIAAGLEPSELTFDIEVTSEDSEFLPDAPALWEQVERLREYKNRLFFASITESCRELFR